MLAAGTAGLSAPTWQPGQSSFHHVLSVPQLFLDSKRDFKRMFFPFESCPQPPRGSPAFCHRTVCGCTEQWPLRPTEPPLGLHSVMAITRQAMSVRAARRGCHTAQGEALTAADNMIRAARGGCLWHEPQPRGSTLPTSPWHPRPSTCCAPLARQCHPWERGS